MSAVVPEIRLQRYVHGRVVPATTIEHDPTRFLMGTEGGRGREGEGGGGGQLHVPRTVSCKRIKVIGHKKSVSVANGAKQRPTRRNANLETQS